MGTSASLADKYRCGGAYGLNCASIVRKELTVVVRTVVLALGHFSQTCENPLRSSALRPV